MSQQTQELPVARGRPLPQEEMRGVWGSGAHLSQLPQLGEALPGVLSEKENDNL